MDSGGLVVVSWKSASVRIFREDFFSGSDFSVSVRVFWA